MHIDHANRIPVAKILSKLPVQPRRIKSNRLLYVSPLHTQKATLFEVDPKNNRWHDHGHNIGGNPVDLVCAYLKKTHEAHTESDALRWLKNMVISPDEIRPVHANTNADIQSGSPSPLLLKKKRPIQYTGLIHYLEKRGIPLKVAQRFLKEVRIYRTQTRKSFLALGFPNEEGGLELSNPFFESCLGPRAITFIRGQTPKPTAIHLFKNVMDYLSAISQLNGRGFNGDAIVLNSLACLKQATSYMQNYGYRTAYSWMPNDKTGEETTTALTEFCRTETGLKHTPMNKTYTPHRDVNAWHMHTLQLTL